jgi:hypothetical protein
MKKTKNIPHVASILLSLLGIYLVAAGIKDTWSFLGLMTNPIFWGLFHLMTGVYLMIRFVKK